MVYHHRGKRTRRRTKKPEEPKIKSGKVNGLEPQVLPVSPVLPKVEKRDEENDSLSKRAKIVSDARISNVPEMNLDTIQFREPKIPSIPKVLLPPTLIKLMESTHIIYKPRDPDTSKIIVEWQFGGGGGTKEEKEVIFPVEKKMIFP